MPEIRDIGVILRQVLQAQAAAPAEPELKQVVAGVNKQIITKKKAGTYANAEVDIPLVDLLPTSVLDSDPAPGSVKVFIRNTFGEFELPYNPVPSADLKSFALDTGKVGTIVAPYLRVTRVSQKVLSTGALVLSQGTAKLANMAGPVDLSVAGLNVTIVGADFDTLNGGVVSGDLLQLVDSGSVPANATRTFRVTAKVDTDTVTLESINPDGKGNLVTSLTRYTNVSVYTPVYTFTDANAKFFSNATRPVDDALPTGSKLYPQPGDTLTSSVTFKGLYAHIVLRPLNADPLVAPIRLRVKAWNSEIQVLVDTLNAVTAPNTVLGVNLRYEIETEEPGIGRVPGASADILQTYSALRKDKLGQVVSVNGADDALEKFGPATADNPLGLAVFMAASNTPSRVVYAAQATEDSAAGHAQALDAIEKVDAYFLCPISTNKGVVDSYVAQALTLSQPDEKRVRIALINLPVPKRLEVADLDTVTVTVGVGLPATLTISGALFLTRAAAPGQYVELNDPDEDGALRKFFITHVVDENVVQVLTLTPDALPALLTGSKNNVKVVSSDFTSDQKVSAFVSIAESYKNRRVMLFSPDSVDLELSGTVITTDGRYWGTLVGAMYASREPGTPISTLNVPFVKKVRGSSDAFTNTQMRALTSAGVFLMIHEVTEALPVIRHQVTTDTTNKKTQEPSFTIVCDSLDLGLKATINPQLGTANLNKEFITAMNLLIDGFFKHRQENRRQIEGYKILELGESTIPGFEDSLAIRVEIDVPHVANNADVTFLL